LLGSDSVQRRQSTVQHVVDAVVMARLFNGGDVGWLLDNANQPLIPRWAGAIDTGIDISDVVADGAEAQAGLYVMNGGREQLGILVAGAQDVECKALRGLTAHAGQLLQFFNKASHRLGEPGQLDPQL